MEQPWIQSTALTTNGRNVSLKKSSFSVCSHEFLPWGLHKHGNFLSRKEDRNMTLRLVFQSVSLTRPCESASKPVGWCLHSENLQCRTLGLRLPAGVHHQAEYLGFYQSIRTIQTNQNICLIKQRQHRVEIWYDFYNLIKKLLQWLPPLYSVQSKNSNDKPGAMWSLFNQIGLMGQNFIPSLILKPSLYIQHICRYHCCL